MNIECNRITLINMYGPNNDSPSFYENLNTIIDEFNNDNITVCGDFNIVLNPELDSHNYVQTNNPRARKKLLELIEYRQLIDSYRQFFPNKKTYTWHKKSNIKTIKTGFYSHKRISIINPAKS